MKLILLSGGSGKRLWPLSNDARSKQFLKVLPAADQEPESMVQRVWRQLAQAGLQEDAYISTGKSQVEALQNQLGPEVPMIVEPERRDTFPAIALAASYLYSVMEVPLEEVIVVLPVDPYVEAQFFTQIIAMEQLLQYSRAELALMGVKPTHPAEKYGYIVPRTRESLTEQEKPYLHVSHFVEKPRKDEAEHLIAMGALWNCGVFAFKLEMLIDLLIEKQWPVSYNQLLTDYHRLPKISFDYEVVEKSNHLVALPYEGEWKDLGTWNTLTEEMAKQQIGKGIITEDCHNTHLINELDIPVALTGLQDTIVAASPDGILVSSKEASPRIKDVVNQFKQRPMYEERRWGWYKVLDFGITPEGNQVLTKRICIFAGQHLSYQKHAKRAETWTIISGSGQFIMNERLLFVSAGDVLQIPLGARHSIRAEQSLEIIEVQQGSELVEDDIERLTFSWDEILQMCEARLQA